MSLAIIIIIRHPLVTYVLQDDTWEGIDMGDGIAVFSSAQAMFGAVKKM